MARMKSVKRRTESETASPLDAAGFSLPYGMQPWRTFVAAGDLGRMLVRMCVLAEPRFALSFVLERTASSVNVCFVVGGASFDVVGPDASSEEAALEGIAALLIRLNDTLRARQIAHRFIVHDGKSEGATNFGYRMLLVDPATAAWAAQSSWQARECIVDEPLVKAKPPQKSAKKGAALPSVRDAEQVVAPKYHLADEYDYPTLLAAYVERLAKFAGALGHGTPRMECVPTPSLAKMFRDDGFFTLRVTWFWRGGGSLQETVKIVTRPRLDIQPIFDCINDALARKRVEASAKAKASADANADGKGAARRVYRCVSRPWGEHAVLATDAEAAELRKAAMLVEGAPLAPALKDLGDAGFALSYLGGWWQSWLGGERDAMGQLARCLKRTCLLAKGVIDLSITMRRDDLGGVLLRFEHAGASAEHAYPHGLNEKNLVDVLPRVYRDLNVFVATRGVSHRFVIMTGKPLWYDHRLLLVSPRWLAAIASAPGLLAESLPADANEMAPLPSPSRYPAEAIDEALPRIARVEEIVAKGRVLDSDFKSSARSEDFPDVVKEIAALAGIALEVDDVAVPDALAHHYDVFVVSKGAREVIRLGNDKYPDVRPIVSYLNGLLAERARDDGRRLYVFTAGGFSGGVVFANDAEASALREAAYLVSDVRGDVGDHGA